MNAALFLFAIMTTAPLCTLQLPIADRTTSWPMVTSCSGQKTFSEPKGLEIFFTKPTTKIEIKTFRPMLDVTAAHAEQINQKIATGKFTSAWCSIPWAEQVDWKLEMEITDQTGDYLQVRTDGMHVQLRGNDGKYWFLRFLPAAQ